MLSHELEQGCHLLLSAGLDYVITDPEPCDIFDMVEGFNQKYARLQLWFAKDLDLAIAPGAIPHVKNSDDAKLILRQGPTYTSCECVIKYLANDTHIQTGQRCTYDTKHLYNNTSTLCQSPQLAAS